MYRIQFVSSCYIYRSPPKPCKSSSGSEKFSEPCRSIPADFTHDQRTTLSFSQRLPFLRSETLGNPSVKTSYKRHRWHTGPRICLGGLHSKNKLGNDASSAAVIDHRSSPSTPARTASPHAIFKICTSPPVCCIFLQLV